MTDHFRRLRSQPQAAGGSDAHARFAEIPDSEVDDELPEPEPLPEERSALTRRALQLIKTDFHETTWQAFWRVAVEEQKPADVAEDLGISVASVYTAKSRVLAHLRSELEGLD